MKVNESKQHRLFSLRRPIVSIFLISIPAILSFLFINSYYFVDQIFIGHFFPNHVIPEAAIGITSPLNGILISWASVVGVGSQLKTTQNIRTPGKLKLVNGSGIISILWWSLLGIIVLLFVQWLLVLIQHPDQTSNIIPYSWDIIVPQIIFLFGLTFMIWVCYNLLNYGHTLQGTLVVGVGTVINIFLLLICCCLFHIGNNAASGLIIVGILNGLAWIVAGLFGLCMILANQKNANDYFVLRHFQFYNWRSLFLFSSVIVLVGIPTLTRGIGVNSATILSNFFISNVLTINNHDVYNTATHQYVGNSYSSSVYWMSIYGRMGGVLVFLLSPAVGILNGCRSLLSYNYEMGNYKRFKQITKLILACCVGYFLLMYFLLFIFNNQFLSILGINGKILDPTNPNLWLVNYKIHSRYVILITWSFTWLYSTTLWAIILFQSTKKNKFAIWTSMLRGIFIGWPISIIFGLFAYKYGNPWIFWSSYPVSDIIGGLIAFIIGFLSYQKIVKNFPRQPLKTAKFLNS